MSEPDMAGMWELSGQELKIILITMPRALMDKEDSTQEQMENVSKDGSLKKKCSRPHTLKQK